MEVLHTQLQGRNNDQLDTKSTEMLEKSTTHNYSLPIKSGIRRPSENLPVGNPKKVSPYGQKFAR